MLKKFIKRALRQFICEHKNTKFVCQISTHYEVEKEGQSELDSQLMAFKRKAVCRDCGKNIVIKYKSCLIKDNF